MTYYILLTFDVEDWFQVENFKQCIPYSSWSSYELRVEKNTHKLLDLLDSIETQNTGDRRQETGGRVISPVSDNMQLTTNNRPPKKSPKATFFVLGWIAERLPHLVKEIYSRGHEVASHGYCHDLCNMCSSNDLKEDLNKSKELLEDITGERVHGYRAPSFSINNGILKIIEDCGFLYDSSYNSFGMHGRYGQIELFNTKQNGIAAKVSDTFYELPISNIRLVGHVLPWGGGGYFRLMPFPIFSLGVKSILKREKSYLFYMHPWEIDPEQPRVNGTNRFYRFRHYINLKRTEPKLLRFIERLGQCRFITCNQYLKEVTHELDGQKCQQVRFNFMS